MSNTDERFENFLGNYKFYENNVTFRIASSKAIEKWKNIQAFQLNQLVNGKFFFPKDRKEILLLKYDLWSRWISIIENLCIEMINDHGHISTKEDIKLIIDLAEKTALKYKNIIFNEHKDKFRSKFVKIWDEQHSVLFKNLMMTFQSFEGFTFDKLFISVVDAMSEGLRHTLIEIYELDVIFCKQVEKCSRCDSKDECPKSKKLDKNDPVPFIVITPLSKIVSEKFGVCLVCDRLKIYRKYFDFDEIYLKNYTDGIVPYHFIKHIEDAGFKINFKKSILQEEYKH